jgi:hypothetical protein
VSSGVSQEDLDQLAALVSNAGNAAGFSALAAAYIFRTGDATRAREAYERAKEARDTADQALKRLLALGASRPGGQVARDTLPLELLDTPAARRYLAALEAAAEAGAELDRERGWLDENGEPVGHGETLAGLALEMRREVYGPEGKE